MQSGTGGLIKHICHADVTAMRLVASFRRGICGWRTCTTALALFPRIEGRRSRKVWRNSPMYLARFSYDVLPANRQKAVEFIRREVAAAREKGLTAKLLIPVTCGQGGAALQFELELTSLDQL